MGSETGYVSSFDEWEGFGFIRPADDPRHLVKFGDDALDGETLADIRPGLEVSYILGPEPRGEGEGDAGAGERWPVARSVTATRPGGARVDPSDSTAAESDAL